MIDSPPIDHFRLRTGVVLRNKVLAQTGTLLFGLMCLAGCQQTETTHSDASSLYAEYGCTQRVENPPEHALSELVADPLRFEGRPVAVEGYYVARFEHSALYATKADGERADPARGVWVLGGVPASLGGERVRLEGILTTGTRGHLGRWPATLCGARVTQGR